MSEVGCSLNRRRGPARRRRCRRCRCRRRACVRGHGRGHGRGRGCCCGRCRCGMWRVKRGGWCASRRCADGGGEVGRVGSGGREERGTRRGSAPGSGSRVQGEGDVRERGRGCRVGMHSLSPPSLNRRQLSEESHARCPAAPAAPLPCCPARVRACVRVFA